MSENKNYLGYIKYEGRLVEEGFLDTRKSAEALLGFDEILRYFVLKDRPDLRDLDFEIPVRIGKGSWGVLIPETIGQWIAAGCGIIATTYLATAAKKMAEKDFSDVGFKDVFRAALRSTQWAIRIAIHYGTITKKKFENVKFRQNNQEIGVPNDRNEYLYVPKRELKLFSELPVNIFSKNTALIEKERAFKVGVYENGKPEEVTITHREKGIFYKEDEEEEILFPELKHGQLVELEGDISRGNKNSNTLGLEYQGHVLNCIPKEGSVVRFKDSLFSNVRVIGVIDRNNEFGKPTAKKPKIIISETVGTESKNKNLPLFDTKESI